MPVSALENKDIAKGWINSLKAKRVLDIGVGQGTYSDLARTPEQSWIGLEVYYPYVEMYNLEGKYDDVIIADARYVDYTKIGKFDLITWGDCIEHMPKDDAKMLLSELLKHTKHLLLAFPVLHLEQHDDDNPYEDHIGHWHYDEMVDYLGDKVIDSMNGDILAYFMIRGSL